MAKHNENLVGFIWNIANKLRGPYRPPQYRRVMLPVTILRRMDCVLDPTKEKVFIRIVAEGMRFELTKQFDPFNRFPGDRLQPLGHPSEIFRMHSK